MRKTIFTSATTALALLSSPLMAAGVAHAETKAAGFPAWATYLGIYSDAGWGSLHNRGICIDSSAAPPTSLVNGQNVGDPKVGYLMTKYISTPNDVDAAALAYIVKKKYDSSRARADAALAEQTVTDQAAINARVAEMRAEAAAKAGPYSVKFGVTEFGRTVAPGSRIHAWVTVKNASKAPVASIPVTFTTSDGQTATVLTNSLGRAAASFVPKQNGSFNVDAKITGALPADHFVQYDPVDGAGYQDIAGAAPLGSWQDPIEQVGITVAPVRYSPTITTKSSAAVVKAGTTLTDTVVMTGGIPNQKYKGTSALYGPYASLAEAQKMSTKKVGTATWSGTTTARGALTTSTTGVKVSATGLYVWQETADAVTTPTATSPAVTGKFGVTSESSLTINPTVGTQVNDQVALPGQTIHDKVTVGGIVADANTVYTLTGNIYSLAPGLDPKVKGNWTFVGKTETKQVVKNGTVTLGSFMVPADAAAGTKYSYDETLTAWRDIDRDNRRDVGETVTESHNLDHSQPAQTSTVGVLKMKTVASSTLAGVGASVSDRIEVSNPAGSAGTVQATLYGYMPASGVAPTQKEWRDAIASGKAKPLYQEDIALSGDIAQTLNTKPVQVARPGWVTWVERYTTPDAPEYTSVTNPGEVPETTLVSKPVVSTMVSAQVAESGATITDTATVGGLVFGPGITNQVRGALMMQAPGSTKWVKVRDIAPVKVTKNGDVANLGAYTVPAGTPTGTKYTYVETLSSAKDGQKVETQHNVGMDVKEQTSWVINPGTVTTKVSDQSAMPGQAISDTASVSGLSFGPGVVNTLSGGLYKQAPGSTTWVKVRNIAPVKVTKNGDVANLGAYTVPANTEIGAKFTYVEQVETWLDIDRDNRRDAGETKVAKHNDKFDVAAQTVTVAPVPAAPQPQVVQPVAQASAVDSAPVNSSGNMGAGVALTSAPGAAAGGVAGLAGIVAGLGMMLAGRRRKGKD